jgi:hypothetical protein
LLNTIQRRTVKMWHCYRVVTCYIGLGHGKEGYWHKFTVRIVFICGSKYDKENL